MKGYHKRRNITQFLKDQHEHEEKKLKRLERISKEREKSEGKTFKPKIDKYSKAISSFDKSKSSLPVHQRLHNLSKDRCRNKIISALGVTS